MTVNQKLAKWQGKTAVVDYKQNPLFTISLLDTMAVKGYEPELSFCKRNSKWRLYLFELNNSCWDNTKEAVIISAALKLIKLEGETAK